MTTTITTFATFLTPVRRSVRGVWRFDAADPLAVRLCLRSGEPWRFSRELLGDAFLRPAGEGAAQLYVSSLGRLVMVLASPGREFVGSCDAGQAWEFLALTRKVCPPGGAGERGAVSAALDRALGRITEGAA